jgi:hypothetical protein
MNIRVYGSALAVLLIFSVSGCGTSKSESIEKITSNPYIDQLDALWPGGITGNLLACMYFEKGNLFILDSPVIDTNVNEAVAESRKRAELYASGKLLQLLKSDIGSAVGFCDDLWEESSKRYEASKRDRDQDMNSDVASKDPNQKVQWDSGVLIDYAACLKSYKDTDYYWIGDKIGFCFRLLGDNYNSNDPKQLFEVQAVQYSACLETWNLYVQSATIDDKIRGCKKAIYN